MACKCAVQSSTHLAPDTNHRYLLLGIVSKLKLLVYLFCNAKCNVIDTY